MQKRCLPTKARLKSTRRENNGTVFCIKDLSSFTVAAEGSSQTGVLKMSRAWSSFFNGLQLETVKSSESSTMYIDLHQRRTAHREFVSPPKETDPSCSYPRHLPLISNLKISNLKLLIISSLLRRMLASLQAMHRIKIH
ncbi:hypothetical protein F2Q68_00034547 [Brassica cretica]|uniref:Uncharacterized protein n=1 Tax=Brassica cretica TaxID=69181 RepID=A0A8S9MTA4_BRACR|nr:hypothetical protein F2Q68_00034547 [Brassica cretica]KAF3486476.1 hypothetical protein F2Q69_00053335 [Brassica cretica]